MTAALEILFQTPMHLKVLQRGEYGPYYGREILLLDSHGRVMLYAVIAADLRRFSALQQTELRAGGVPFGSLLSRYQIPFQSVPSRYFTISALPLIEGTQPLYGRFARLIDPAGEPFAWMLEVPTSSER